VPRLAVRQPLVGSGTWSDAPVGQGATQVVGAERGLGVIRKLDAVDDIFQRDVYGASRGGAVIVDVRLLEA
jgi:hypothetical protein